MEEKLLRSFGVVPISVILQYSCFKRHSLGNLVENGYLVVDRYRNIVILPHQLEDEDDLSAITIQWKETVVMKFVSNVFFNSLENSPMYSLIGMIISMILASLPLNVPKLLIAIIATAPLFPVIVIAICFCFIVAVSPFSQYYYMKKGELKYTW